MNKLFETYRQLIFENQLIKIDGGNLLKDHIRMIEIFNPENNKINEDDNEIRNDVLEKIKNNDYEKPDPKKFYESMNKSKHKEMLSPYDEGDLNNLKLFKLNGYDIGFALKSKMGKLWEIVSVFNNSNVRNIGKELVMSAVKNGGCYLDHFDGFLSNLYSSLGFIETNREKFNPDYDPDEKFRKKYGEADVIHRVYKNCLN